MISLINHGISDNVGSNSYQTIANWTMEKESDGIKVYTRNYEGTDSKEFKAITTVTLPMKSLEKLIEDVENFPSWQENVSSAKLLKQINSNEQYVYFTTDTPWPVNDRDMIIHTNKIIEDNGAITYTMDCNNDYIEENDDFIRIKVAKGFWKFTPEKDNKIEVIYQFYGDPAGSIPNWLINLFIVKGPYITLENIKNMK